MVRRTKFTDFKPMQDELNALREENARLLEFKHRHEHGLDLMEQGETIHRLTRDRDEARAKLAKVVEALEWMRNLASGVGRAGAAPEVGEYESACDASDAALAAAKEE